MLVKINEEFRNAVASHQALIEAELEEQPKQILSGLETARVTGAGALMKTRYLAALCGQLDTGVSSRTCGQLRVNFSMSVQQHAQVCAVVLVVF